MKKFKIAVWALITLFVLLLAAILVLAKILVTPENVQTALAFESAKYFGREIRAEKVTVHYLKKITLENVHTAGPPNGPLLFSCKEITVRHGLLPLLIKRLQIKKIRIKAPDVSLRLKKGRFTGLLKRKPASASGRPVLGLFFLPNSVLVKGGTLNLENGKDVLRFENLALTADPVSLMFPFQAELSADLSGSRDQGIRGRAEITIPKKRASLNLNIRSLPVTKICRLFEADSIPLTAGTLSAEITLDYRNAGIGIQGTAALDNPAIRITVQNKAVTLRDADTRIDYKAAYHPDKKKLVLQQLDGTFVSQQFTGKGSVMAKSGGPLADITLRSDNFSLEKIFAQTDIGLDSPFYGLRLTGGLGITARLKGIPGKNMTPTLSIMLKGNRIVYPPLANLQPELIGSFSMDSSNISVKSFTLRAVGSSFTFTGIIPDYRTWPPRPNLRVTASKLDLARLFSKDAARSGTEPLEDIGPFNFSRVSLKGPLALGDTYLYGMPLNNVQGAYTFADNIFTIQNLSGNIGEGRFELSAKIDLGVEGLDYYLYLKLKNAGLDKLSILVSPVFRRYVEGNLSGNLAIKGAGTSPFSLHDNLKADAAFYMKNGLIRNLRFKPPLSSFIAMQKLKSIPFRSGTLNARLRNSVLDIDSTIISEYLEFYSEGDIYMDTEMDLEAKVRINEEIFKGGKALAKFLPREAGLISLPLIIRGTFKNPDISMPEDTMKFIMQESLPALIMGMMGGSEDKELDNSFQEIMSIFQAGMQKKNRGQPQKKNE